MNIFRFKTNNRIADLEIDGILDCDICADTEQEAINEFRQMTLNEGVVIYDDEFTVQQVLTVNQIHEQLFNRYIRTY